MQCFGPPRGIFGSISTTSTSTCHSLIPTAGLWPLAAVACSPPYRFSTSIGTHIGWGGTANGTVALSDDTWTFESAKLYCERNWGAGFPERWWWGQAHDFGDADASVAFSGGLLALGPISRDVSGVVVRLGDRVIRITPPYPVRSELAPDRWSIHGRSLRYRIDLEGDGAGQAPHVLPVPLPAERRNIDTDFEHLAGRLHCVVRERGRVIFDETSELAALEVGSRP